MKFKHECPYCDIKLLLDKSDIRKLNKKERKFIDEDNRETIKMSKMKTFFGNQKYSNHLIYSLLRNPIGVIKCICGRESFFGNKELTKEYLKGDEK